MLWTVEHGPRGGDEINIPRPGKNYGWPVITYGIDYDGMPVEGGITQKAGMEQPLYYWDPVIAPSGFMFYTGTLFPEWKDNLFIGGLRGQRVSRLVLNGDKIVGEEWLFTQLHKRIRDVRQGPDGAIYLLTDETAGQILKVTPKPSGRPRNPDLPARSARRDRRAMEEANATSTGWRRNRNRGRHANRCSSRRPPPYAWSPPPDARPGESSPTTPPVRTRPGR